MPNSAPARSRNQRSTTWTPARRFRPSHSPRSQFPGSGILHTLTIVRVAKDENGTYCFAASPDGKSEVFVHVLRYVCFVRGKWRRNIHHRSELMPKLGDEICGRISRGEKGLRADFWCPSNLLD
jgi:hypothetical protein